MTMSRFSITVQRQTQRTLIGEYKSSHRLHLSVVSQHMRRKSLKRLKLRLTLIVEATPPLWHSFLRHFHWMTHFLPEVPRRHLRQQRQKAQHRNVNRDKISCQLAIQEKVPSRPSPYAEPHPSRHTAAVLPGPPSNATAHGFASGVILTVSVQCGARFCRQFPKHRSEHLRMVRGVLHQRPVPI